METERNSEGLVLSKDLILPRSGGSASVPFEFTPVLRSSGFTKAQDGPTPLTWSQTQNTTLEPDGFGLCGEQGAAGGSQCQGEGDTGVGGQGSLLWCPLLQQTSAWGMLSPQQAAPFPKL